MSPERLALARRVVKAPGWRWLPGMAFCDPSNPLWTARFVDSDLQWVLISSQVTSAEIFAAVPDLDDELTRLGLAAVGRVAAGESTIYAEHRGTGRWMVMQWSGHLNLRIFGHGPTEEAAWVDAICAASVKP